MTTESQTLTIHDLARGGQGVARSAEGMVYFVPFTAPGDEVRVREIKKEKRYVTTELLEITKPSPSRVIPKCPVFTKCGGCEWQHIPYETQWKKKFDGAKAALQRAKIEVPTDWSGFPAKQHWNYRNRVQMRGERGQLGFFARGSRNLVPVDSCAIAHPKINAAIAKVVAEANYHRLPPYKVEIEIDEKDQVHWTFNAKHAALGFRQINDEQNTPLVKFITDQISDQATVYDLYGGDGNFSRPLVRRTREIFCVDVVAPFRDVTHANLHFEKTAVLSWLLKQRAVQRPQVEAIIDPPREGLGDDAKEIFSALYQAGCERVILVGCDPDSWARDLTRALDVNRENGKGWQKAWKLVRCASFDLFPQTHHIESVAVLHRMS